MIEFTDQAPRQYKNKIAFRYLCQDKKPRERNFFGIRHGKGPCDACAGRIKGRLAKLVKSETCIVNSARSCFEACKEHFETKWPENDECCHYMLTFSFTSKISKRPSTDKWKGVRDGTYCGLWQMAQAANVLRRPVISVYPNELHEGMRLDFNRTFYCVDNRYNERQPVVIMWTPMQVAENSLPVHFVPLLKAVSYCFTRKYVYIKYFLSMKYTCFVQHFIFLVLLGCQL